MQVDKFMWDREGDVVIEPPKKPVDPAKAEIKIDAQDFPPPKKRDMEPPKLDGK